MKLQDKNKVLLLLLDSLKEKTCFAEIEMIGHLMEDEHPSMRMSYILMANDIIDPHVKNIVKHLERLNDVDLSK
jgi:hypothetical protein